MMYMEFSSSLASLINILSVVNFRPPHPPTKKLPFKTPPNMNENRHRVQVRHYDGNAHVR